MLHKQIHLAYQLFNGQVEQSKATKHHMQLTQSFGDVVKNA